MKVLHMKVIVSSKLLTVSIIGLLLLLTICLSLPIVQAGEWNTPVQLTSNPNGAWSLTAFPNARSISYYGEKIVFMSNFTGNSEIFTVNSDGSGLRQLTNNQSLDTLPSISGDGKKISFCSNRTGHYEVFVINSDGSGLLQLTDNKKDVYPMFSSISGNGSKIAFESFSPGYYGIFVVNSSGSTPPKMLSTGTHTARCPSICGDGSRIAFSYSSSISSDSGLYVVNSDGSAPPKQLTTKGAMSFPSISFDGNKIAFSWLDSTSEYQVLVINADGTGLTQITTGSSCFTPSISGDGSKVAFANSTGKSTEIYVINSDGSEPKRLTYNTAAEILPSISGDGRKVVFASNITSSYMHAARLDIFLVFTPPDFVAPATGDNYDGQWHTADFFINLTATDNFIGVKETYYRMNNGLVENVTAHGQPIITSEGADNKLDYWSVDRLGNVEPPHNLTGIKLDKTVPTGSFTINNGAAYTNSPSVTLNLSATNTVSGIQARISNDNQTYDSRPLANSITWTLPNGDGLKTVYVQFKTTAGLTSTILNHSICLDTQPPSIELTASLSNGTEIKSSTYVLSWTATKPQAVVDAGFGVDHCEVRLDDNDWVNTHDLTTYTFTGLSDGSHTFSIKAVDKTNKFRIYSVTVTINTSLFGPPGHIAEYIVAALVIIIVVAVIVYKILRRPKPPPAPKAFKLQADQTQVIADRTSRSKISIQLLDQNGKPIAAARDTEIRLNTTKGSLEKSTVTIPKGKDSGEAVLVSSAETGPATVSIEAKGMKTANLTINFIEKKRYCMHCGTIMPFTAKLCQKCGNSPPAGVDTKTCMNCQSTIPVVAKFCSECGAGQTEQGNQT
jgi:Tol biopolymer transport system component/ribosomal protein L40E